jgi:hypothetical protein
MIRNDDIWFACGLDRSFCDEHWGFMEVVYAPVMDEDGCLSGFRRSLRRIQWVQSLTEYKHLKSVFISYEHDNSLKDTPMTPTMVLLPAGV